ncbi:hypothetical protein GT755_09030 [Herbidospora sp. NEAU-GS84]|uniref:Uncharacterized protein n=1 Tax=Herbidospora solisilvae TaxID=2696284 RepID=A0A7C9J1U0_9ACTN|nr:hypothetical protein [Herbidospora solisilvae]NAS21825.1 hypothetical protein [Herbidospora solisilvae]
MATEASFIGLSPWSGNDYRIDFETPVGAFDLHNNAHFESISFFAELAEVVLAFRYAANWEEIDDNDVNVWLKFTGVRMLRLNQAADFDPQAAITLEGITHRVASAGSEFEIDAGDWTCGFMASSLELETTVGEAGHRR